MLQASRYALHDIIALIANTISLITSSLSFGTSNPDVDFVNIRKNLISFQESYLKLISIIHTDLGKDSNYLTLDLFLKLDSFAAKTTDFLSKIPGFGLVRFAIQVPILVLDKIKNFLYKILVALGISY